MTAVAEALPSVLSPALPVRAWVDPVVDAVGHDPRSLYVERFWLGVVGPSALWFLRRVVADLDDQPDGFDLDLDDTARALGLSYRGGRRSAFGKTLERCCRFQLTRFDGHGVLHVRRRLAPLSQWQVARLPATLQDAHREWVERAGLDPVDDASVEVHSSPSTSPSCDETTSRRHRARQLALSLLEIGEDAEATERQLLRWRFGAKLSREATVWGLAHLSSVPATPAPAP